VVPKIAVEEEIARSLVQPVNVQGLNLKRKFNLVYHRQKFFTRAIQSFVDFCKTGYSFPA
jgi:DNA-binding transcriptional LysR family regulator